MVIVSMVSESGMEVIGLEVETDDKFIEAAGAGSTRTTGKAKFEEDQSIVSVGVILIELTLWSG